VWTKTVFVDRRFADGAAAAQNGFVIGGRLDYAYVTGRLAKRRISRGFPISGGIS
jgi:hypothetical protein